MVGGAQYGAGAVITGAETRWSSETGAQVTTTDSTHSRVAHVDFTRFITLPLVTAVESTTGSILAVDIGATTIKFGLIDSSGQLIESVRRVPTPYPCTPERLIEVVVDQIVQSGCTRIGVGFPGDFVDGRVIEPGNLSRPGGITTDVDPEILAAWRGFDLQDALRAACPRDIRVVNDATLAALGYCNGHGRELAFTLGTGFGIALVVDGSVVKIRDVGDKVFRDGGTYDEVLGERFRARDQRRWNELLVEAIDAFVEEFDADTVHLGGGNARLVDLALFDGSTFAIEVNDNDGTLRGAAKLFEHPATDQG